MSETDATWPMVLHGDKVVHVSEVPMLHPGRLWQIVARMMRARTKEARREFVELIANFGTESWKKRSEPRQVIGNELRAVAGHLTQAVKAIARLGTKRGEAGVA